MILIFNLDRKIKSIITEMWKIRHKLVAGFFFNYKNWMTKPKRKKLQISGWIFF